MKSIQNGNISLKKQRFKIEMRGSLLGAHMLGTVLGMLASLMDTLLCSQASGMCRLAEENRYQTTYRINSCSVA